MIVPISPRNQHVNMTTEWTMKQPSEKIVCQERASNAINFHSMIVVLFRILWRWPTSTVRCLAAKRSTSWRTSAILCPSGWSLWSAWSDSYFCTEKCAHSALIGENFCSFWCRLFKFLRKFTVVYDQYYVCSSWELLW